jgi:hypothetical protein
MAAGHRLDRATNEAICHGKECKKWNKYQKFWFVLELGTAPS